MQVRVAAASTLAALAWAAGVFAQVAEGSQLTATGQVVSTGNTSLVVKTDARGESTAFVVSTSTQLPPGLAAGNRVTVHYHSVGDRLVADRVVLGAASTQPGPTEAGPPADRPGGANRRTSLDGISR